MPRSPQCLATSVTRAARVRFPPWASFSQTTGCVRRLLGQRVPAAGSPQQLGRSAQGPGSTPARAASPRASKKNQHRSRNWRFCSAFLLRLGGNTESGSESFQPSLLERFPLCRVTPAPPRAPPGCHPHIQGSLRVSCSCCRSPSPGQPGQEPSPCCPFLAHRSQALLACVTVPSPRRPGCLEGLRLRGATASASLHGGRCRIFDAKPRHAAPRYTAGAPRAFNRGSEEGVSARSFLRTGGSLASPRTHFHLLLPPGRGKKK